jgi:hypothetical protein
MQTSDQDNSTATVAQSRTVRRLSLLLLLELCALLALLTLAHHVALDRRIRRLFRDHDAILTGDSLVVRGVEHSQFEGAMDMRICRIARSGAGIYCLLTGHLYARELDKAHVSGVSFSMTNRPGRLDYARYPLRLDILRILHRVGYTLKDLAPTIMETVNFELSMVPSPSQWRPPFGFLTGNNLDTPILPELNLKELEAYRNIARSVREGSPNAQRRLAALSQAMQGYPHEREVVFEIQTSEMLRDITGEEEPAQRRKLRAALEAAGVPYVFVGDFIDPDRPDAYYFGDLSHLNIRGRELATDELARKLRDTLADR